nr:nucleotide exchange factor GrpE [Aminipila terrae]
MNKDQTATENKDAIEDVDTQVTDDTEAITENENAEEKCVEGETEETLTDEADGKQTEEAAAGDEELNKKYLRLMADFQNYKRRTEKEKCDIYAYANEKIVSELLDVIDNFERALAHGEGDEGFVQGMNNIFKIFKGYWKKAD